MLMCHLLIGVVVGVEAALARRNLKLAAAAPYERNTDKVEEAVRSCPVQAISIEG